MLRYFLFFVSFLAGATTLAAPLSAEGASALRAQFQTRQRETLTWSVTIVQTLTLAGLRDPVVSTGTLAYRASDRLRLDYTKPARELVLVLGDRLFIQKSGTRLAEKSLREDSAGKPFLSLLGLLRGQPAEEESDYTPEVTQPIVDETTRDFSVDSLENLPYGLDGAHYQWVDLDGEGLSSVLTEQADGWFYKRNLSPINEQRISEDEVFCWHPSLAEAGFGPPETVRKVLDEEKGPVLVFADATQSIYLADISGDGLTDLVRIRNGEVCYWPNLGYGQFGAKVTMDDAPWFDAPDLFNQQRIRLADIDGSGVTDILYLGHDGVHLYFNQSGNRWSPPRILSHFPPIDNVVAVTVVDLLGNGAACLVWSSPLPGDAGRHMRYVDLMGGQKPHLLVKSANNLGAETIVHYAPSTKFYLADKLAGNPWITRLPFPVHVLERVETYDRISRNRFVTRYAYHHGYFDGIEREFRGFGMIEQWDTEEFAALSDSDAFPVGDNIDAASHVPPVHTKTWFHTGVYLGRDKVSNFFAGLRDANDQGEYYREPGLTDPQARELLLDDTILPDGLTLEEEGEACRALKGAMLRQEIYALDETDKQAHPYTLTEQSFTLRRLQPRADNRYGAFFTHAREALNYHYERNPQDPRVSHAMTLEVDPFGNVLKSVAVGYERRVSDLSEPFDREKQTRSLVTYTESGFTNAIDEPDAYRAPLPSESRTYELTGYRVAAGQPRFTLADFVRDDGGHLEPVFNSELNYEELPTGGRQRRPIEHVRTLYRRDDLFGSLSLGVLEPLALPFESYKLDLTPGLITQVYGDRVTGAMLEGDGRYVHSEGVDNWWIPSGRVFLSPGTNDTPAAELQHARQHFFLPRNAIVTPSTPTRSARRVSSAMTPTTC